MSSLVIDSDGRSIFKMAVKSTDDSSGAFIES